MSAHTAAGDLAADAAPELSIVMPCLNEAETLPRCIAKTRAALERLGVSGEIVVADNGSSDGSPEVARGLGARVVEVTERGYGSAVAGGITAARGHFVIMGDADDSYDFSAIAPFVAKLREGFHLVMGNRFAGGIAPGAMPALNRYLGNPVLSFLGRLFFRAPCHDLHCGLRGFDREAIMGLDLRTTGMEFASEMVVKAVLAGLRIAEVPTTLAPAGRSRPPHLRPWRDGWRHLRFLLLYSPRWLFLLPGTILMVLGVAVGGWLLGGPRTVGGVTLDVDTLLYAALAVLVGFQAIVFAVFTKVFAITEGLLPADPRFMRLFRIVTLEVGLAVGAALVAAGVIASLAAVRMWQGTGYGPLEPVRVLRLVIPAATAVALGCQVILASFFLSVLGLKRR